LSKSSAVSKQSASAQDVGVRGKKPSSAALPSLDVTGDTASVEAGSREVEKFRNRNTAEIEEPAYHVAYGHFSALFAISA